MYNISTRSGKVKDDLKKGRKKMLTDQIAQMIEEMLASEGGILELRRNEMAQKLGCVPSQISYVITSRFTPERGYIIESRRGGGGCIRIVRKEMTNDEFLSHCFYSIGERLSESEAMVFIEQMLAGGVITSREANIMAGALLNTAFAALPRSAREVTRANIFRHILLSIMN